MIPAIVLAAGTSTRMGRAKALLPLGADATFLTRIVETFHDAEVDDVVVVVGHDASAIMAAFDRRWLTARFIVNADYESGQLTSLVAGLSAIDRPGVSAALIMLVDTPLVRPETVRAIVGRYRESGAPVVRPVSGGRHGHPVLIDRSLFDALRAQDPAHGSKALIRRHASPAGDVHVEDEGAFIDIDTPEEYESIVRRLRPSSG